MKYQTTNDGVAQLSISGPLSEKPRRILSLFGGGSQTSYAELRETLTALEGDPRVKSVEFAMDTPGGNVDGLYETMRAFRAFSKPTTAIIKNAHSAGFGLIASMDRRVAASDLSSVGSVGVVASFYVSDSSITIRSSASPHKNPDPKTEEGKAQLQEYIDKVYGFFAAELAKGMPQLGGNYGQGKVLFAADAMALGLIDSIAQNPGSANRPQASSAGGLAASGGDEFARLFRLEAGMADDVPEPRSDDTVQSTVATPPSSFANAFLREIGQATSSDSTPEDDAQSDRDEHFAAAFAREIGRG